MRRKENGRKKDHLRLATRAQRIFKRRHTFVPPLYFGSKNAATRPIVTRVSRAARLFPDLFSPFLFLLASPLSFSLDRDPLLSFGFNEQRLRALALTAFQFVRIPLPFSINYLLSLALAILDRQLPSIHVHFFSNVS